MRFPLPYLLEQVFAALLKQLDRRWFRFFSFQNQSTKWIRQTCTGQKETGEKRYFKRRQIIYF